MGACMDQKDWGALYNVAGPAGAIGFAVALFRGVIDQCGGWRRWVASLFASVLVAVFIGLGLHDTGVPVIMQSAVVGLCSYIARDILMGLTQLSGMLATSPLEFLQKVREAIKGRQQ